MAKIIIFGGSGFIGKSLIRFIEKSGADYISVSSKDINLILPDSVKQISETVKSGDSIILLSALTPEKGKDWDVCINNLLMVKHLLSGIEKIDVKQCVYVSTDAVYPLTNDVIDETSVINPTNLYGYSHAVRERMIIDYFPAEKLTILRPCAVYGFEDAHNSYGIMRFVRSAVEKGEIHLFGGGEEYRDHVHADDLSQIIAESIMKQIPGIFNIATGKSFRFYEIAELIKSRANKKINIINKPRSLPILHRHVNTAKLSATFPNSPLRSVQNGVQYTMKEYDLL